MSCANTHLALNEGEAIGGDGEDETFQIETQVLLCSRLRVWLYARVCAGSKKTISDSGYEVGSELNIECLCLLQ